MNDQLFRKKSMEKITSPENLNDYIRVASPGVWMTLCAVILLSVQVSAPEKKGGALSDSDRKLVIDQPHVVPESPASPHGYSTARKTPERWSGKDVEKWFTVPDRTEIEALGRANDRRIEEIIGAAP